MEILKLNTTCLTLHISISICVQAEQSLCKVNGPEKMCQAFALCNVSSYVVNPIASKSQAANVSLQDFLTQIHSAVKHQNGHYIQTALQKRKFQNTKATK